MIQKLLLVGAALFSLGLAPPSNEVAQQTTPKQIELKPMDLTWEQQQKVFLYGTLAVLDQCKAQPSVLWCNTASLPEKPLTAYDIIQLSLDAKAKFRYTSDTVDTWRVHSSEVLMKQEWYGDCDDLTSTTLDLIVRAGHPRSKVWMVLADVEHKGMLDHLIGMVQDIDGHYWIIGDTSAQNAYPASRVKYRIVGTARGDHMTLWEDPHVVGAFPADALQSNAIQRPIEPIQIKLLEFKLLGSK